ncbi:MAG: hypothetical protein NTX22_11030 [Ignavibacteriales bacterium]|nr:hypothetical protein [Ignavibacteriales bacterium]
MIDQIKNTSFATTTNSTKTISITGQSLPEVNSLVMLKVIEKLGGNYKILINGNLFQAKLPLKLTAGEEAIAKVLSTKPFTLGLNDLLKTRNMSSENISLLLSMLGLEQDEKNIRFIKKLISSKQPLRKEKIKRGIEFLEKTNGEVDELQLALLVRVYAFQNDYFDYMAESHNSFFKYSYSQIIQNIFGLVKQLNYEFSNNTVTQIVNNYLVCNYSLLENENKLPVCCEEKLLEMIGIVAFESGNNSYPFIIKEICDSLKKNITLLIIQTAVYNYFGLYPSFIILLQENKFNLIEFNSYKEKSDKDENYFKFGIKIPTNNPDEILLKGFLTKELLYTNIFFMGEKKHKHELELTKTSEEFHFKYNLDAYIGINENPKNNNISIWNSNILTGTY